MKLALIDADGYAYRGAIAANTVFGFSIELARQTLGATFGRLLDRLKCDDFKVCLSDRSKRYFRHNILPSYKAHRTHGVQPDGVEEIKSVMMEEYNAVIKPGLEADDCCGILATMPGADTVVVSTDKDLRTIPGYHFNPDKPGDGVYVMSEKWANWNHLYQTLTGDQCDGFKGCPKVGPVRAKAILGDNPQWSNVVKAFEARGLTEADALVQARVARILRWSDWDHQRKEPILWNPSTSSSPSSSGSPSV